MRKAGGISAQSLAAAGASLVDFQTACRMTHQIPLSI